MIYPMGRKGSYFKICLIGDGGVGKTSIRKRALGGGFKSTYLLTIGADFATYKIKIEGIEYKFQIWDLAGQARFDVVRSIYYKGSHGAIMVFDVTRPESLSNLEKWKQELFTHVGRKIPFILLGNKCDRKSKIDQKIDQVALYEFIKQSEKEFLSTENPFTIPYLNTSARTDQNIKEAFVALAMTVRKFTIFESTNTEM